MKNIGTFILALAIFLFIGFIGKQWEIFCNQNEKLFFAIIIVGTISYFVISNKKKE